CWPGSSTSCPARPASKAARIGARSKPPCNASRIVFWPNVIGMTKRRQWRWPAAGAGSQAGPAYHHAMSRIGQFADDDVYSWAAKSPDLGGAIANFSQAVYTKNRLPMRTRELARAVIAHD